MQAKYEVILVELRNSKDQEKEDLRSQMQSEIDDLKRLLEEEK